MMKPPLLIVLGPTAVGKTKLSLELALRYNGEIVSGDSMQVYRGMDVGTAKATPQERALVPHHLIDIHDPDYPFSVAEFQQLAHEAIADIAARGKLPMLVGGTGLYIESLCYGFEFTDVGIDERYRRELADYAEAHGDEALHAKLHAVDPASAAKLHPNDRRRIIRALEIERLSGKPLSEHLAGQKKESPYECCFIGLTMEREALYRRIDQRVDAMLAEGLVDEVRRLLRAGYTSEHISMQGIGYKEIAAYLAGEVSLEEAASTLKRNTRRFAKRQLSWFRHMRDIHWIDVTHAQNFFEQVRYIHGILAGKFGM
ncbi:tRNA delta(2)-isopentenylpyrophosphate transferase [Gordoniibacillus kamchatkensis]|uniref:tRNA dimethylallyltransferase n=1 Tax=Gordoniibacillus kamchatkensis TaxID=1590651 RepID=A0ABR5AFA1_9BACL|nr:tRNA (adenosine(37)-N6)-dimethylallyltransferase MiaA [Paenibacillus sp. VKM B-2647]KIL39503.1 tRNA delta(2)-isopentenylpyrophosphate transferase [Paenibacillus sp. VKM B-2647]